MFLRYLHVEFLKLRGSLALLLCVAAPACIAILGALVVLERGGDWAQFALGNAGFWSFAMLPLTLTALSVLLAQMEHGSRSWDHLLALPHARTHVILAKAVVMLALVAAMSLLLFVLLHCAAAAVEIAAPGRIKGTPDPFRIAGVLARMAVAATLVAMLQLWVALRFRSFVVPLVFGIAGTFAALVATASEKGIYFPWLMATNILAADPGRQSLALLMGGFGGAIALVLMLLHLSRRDMVNG